MLRTRTQTLNCHRLTVNKQGQNNWYNLLLRLEQGQLYINVPNEQRTVNIAESTHGKRSSNQWKRQLHIFQYLIFVLIEFLIASACPAICFNFDARLVIPVQRVEAFLQRVTRFTAPYCFSSGWSHVYGYRSVRSSYWTIQARGILYQIWKSCQELCYVRCSIEDGRCYGLEGGMNLVKDYIAFRSVGYQRLERSNHCYGQEYMQ